MIRHFAFATNDVDACVEAVKAAGYEVFIEPKDIEIASTPVFPARIAFCKGPLGEEIELFEEKVIGRINGFTGVLCYGKNSN